MSACHSSPYTVNVHVCVPQIDEYRPKLKTWYNEVTSDDSKQSEITDKLQMEQWMRICDEKDLIGIWECYRESDITGDPACKTEYKWRLSMPQVKMAFMDSQPTDSLTAAQSSGTVSAHMTMNGSPSPRSYVLYHPAAFSIYSSSTSLVNASRRTPW